MLRNKNFFINAIELKFMEDIALSSSDLIQLQKESFASAEPNQINHLLVYAIGSQIEEIECIKILIAKNADIHFRDDFGTTFLYHAAARGHINIIQTLLEANASINTQNDNGKTPLIGAAEKGHVKCLELLLTHHADIHLTCHYGKTALIYATHDNSTLECCTALIRARSNVNHQSTCGTTPLIEATKYPDGERIQILLDAKADIDLEDNSGDTALLWAAFYRNIKIIDLLLEKNSDINHINFLGNSALHESLRCYSNSAACTEFLINHKVNINHKSNNNRSALYIASSHGYYESMMLLLASGAHVGNTDEDSPVALWSIIKSRDKIIYDPYSVKGLNALYQQQISLKQKTPHDLDEHELKQLENLLNNLRKLYHFHQCNLLSAIDLEVRTKNNTPFPMVLLDLILQYDHAYPLQDQRILTNKSQQISEVVLQEIALHEKIIPKPHICFFDKPLQITFGSETNESKAKKQKIT